ncbi:MAG: glutamate cyclase domain-containing protein [Pirellulales bacterium]
MHSTPLRQPTNDEARIRGVDGQIDWPAVEAVVHVDPAGRGLASFREHSAPLDAGQLRSAALELALRARAVGIVTGFCVAGPAGMTAETDGPPGALFLARALAAVGVDVCLIGDRHVMPLFECGREMWKLREVELLAMPIEGEAASIGERSRGAEENLSGRWATEFFGSPRGRSLTHLIAIERPGPSHTLESLAAQRATSQNAVDRFVAAVPEMHRDVCHNMRGESIEEHTARADRLFAIAASQRPPIVTVGIGDGGNEIGMGHFAWEKLVAAVGGGVAERIVCRTATDHAIIAGVSNWGGYALALAVARLRGAVQRGQQWNSHNQRTLIEALVRHAGAVDGLTGRREPTVDGLPLDVYLRPLDELRLLLGFDGPNQ